MKMHEPKGIQQTPKDTPDAKYADGETTKDLAPSKLKEDIGEQTLKNSGAPDDGLAGASRHMENSEVADLLKAITSEFRKADNGLHTQLWERVAAATRTLEGKVKGVHHRPFDPTRRPEDQPPLTQEEIKGSTGKMPESGIPTVHTADGDSAARTH